MENLSNVEEIIVDYLIKSDKLSDSLILSDKEFYESQTQYSNIFQLLSFLLKKDNLLKDVGLKFSLDQDENILKLKIKINPERIAKTESSSKALRLIKLTDNHFLRIKLNYLLVRLVRFLEQLEKDGYIDSIELENTDSQISVMKKHSEYLLEINTEENYVQLSHDVPQKITELLIISTSKTYVPNYKLREFHSNGFKSTTLKIAERDVELAKLNNKLSKITLYISIFSFLGSVIATSIAFYSIGIPATVKIDQVQVEKILDSFERDNSINNFSELHENPKDSVLIQNKSMK